MTMTIKQIVSYGKYFTPRRFREFVVKFGHRIDFIKSVFVLYYCMRDPKTPKYIKLVILGALGYLILPADMVPDVLLGIGWLDDLAVMTTVTKLAQRYITEEHERQAKGKIPFMRK